MNIRSLKGRLRKVEQRIKTTHLAAFERSLSPEQRQALDNANLHSLIADDCDPDGVGVEILMDELGLDEDGAIDLWARFQAAQNNDQISDDEFDRMSEEELVEYIAKTREELREMVAEDEAA